MLRLWEYPPPPPILNKTGKGKLHIHCLHFQINWWRIVSINLDFKVCEREKGIWSIFLILCQFFTTYVFNYYFLRNKIFLFFSLKTRVFFTFLGINLLDFLDHTYYWHFLPARTVAAVPWMSSLNIKYSSLYLSSRFIACFDWKSSNCIRAFGHL